MIIDFGKARVARVARVSVIARCFSFGFEVLSRIW